MGWNESKVQEKEIIEQESFVKQSSGFVVFKDISSIVNLKNYGVLPTNSLHHIFLFLDTNDLLNIFLTCKLFHKVTHTNYFWKEVVSEIIKHENIRKFEEFLESEDKKESSVNNYKEVYYNYFVSTYKARNLEFSRIFERTSNKHNLKESYNVIKLLTLGDCGVGKSSYLRRFVDGSFDKPQFLSCVSLDFKINSVLFNKKLYKLQLWDTAGQERFREISPGYYLGSHGILLCFSIDDKTSFDNLKFWFGKIISNQKKFGNKKQVVVVCGMKKDLEGSDQNGSNKRVVTKSMIFEMMRDLRLPMKDYCECSSKQDLYTFFPFGRLIEKFCERLGNDQEQ